MYLKFRCVLILSTVTYFNPSFLYPAAFVYHLEIGSNTRYSHGRLMIKLAKCGADIVIIGCMLATIDALTPQLGLTRLDYLAF